MTTLSAPVRPSTASRPSAPGGAVPDLRAEPCSPLRCAYCHDSLGPRAPKPCLGCGTQLHAGCWEEVGRCPTLGCRVSVQDWPVLIRPGNGVGPSQVGLMPRLWLVVLSATALWITFLMASGGLSSCACRALRP